MAKISPEWPTHSALKIFTPKWTYTNIGKPHIILVKFPYIQRIFNSHDQGDCCSHKKIGVTEPNARHSFLPRFCLLLVSFRSSVRVPILFFSRASSPPSQFRHCVAAIYIKKRWTTLIQRKFNQETFAGRIFIFQNNNRNIGACVFSLIYDFAPRLKESQFVNTH